MSDEKLAIDELSQEVRSLAERLDSAIADRNEALATIRVSIERLASSRESQKNAIAKLRTDLNEATRQNDDKIDEVSRICEQCRTSINRFNAIVGEVERKIENAFQLISARTTESREGIRTLTENWDRLAGSVKELQDTRPRDLAAYDEKVNKFYDRLHEKLAMVSNDFVDHMRRYHEPDDRIPAAEDDEDMGVRASAPLADISAAEFLALARKIAIRAGIPVPDVIAVLAVQGEIS